MCTYFNILLDSHCYRSFNIFWSSNGSISARNQDLSYPKSDLTLLLRNKGINRLAFDTAMGFSGILSRRANSLGLRSGP